VVRIQPAMQSSMPGGKRKKSDDKADPGNTKDDEVPVDKRVRTLSTAGLLEARLEELNWEQWNVEDVVSFLEKNRFDEYAPNFRGNCHYYYSELRSSCNFKF